MTKRTGTICAVLMTACLPWLAAGCDDRDQDGAPDPDEIHEVTQAVSVGGAPFINPVTGALHKFVAGNYTDLGVNPDGSMPTDRTALEWNATQDLNRLRDLGVTNVRIWAHLGYASNNYGAMANRVNWLAELARQRGMTLTVDLFDSSGNNTLQNLRNNEAQINNMVSYVVGGNANKSYIYWSLGNEIGDPWYPLDFADFYVAKVQLMRQSGALRISLQPVPGSLNHNWGGTTTQAATRVINASDDVSVHFYAAGAVGNEGNVNGLELGSTQQWMNLAHSLCKPAVIGEFGITDLAQRTDQNVSDWLYYFRENLKVDQVSFWQLTKDEAGHVDGECFCSLPNVGNGPHISGMSGYLGLPPTYPGSGCTTSCTASVPAGSWTGRYWNNLTFTGSPVLTRDDGAGTLSFDWGLGSPGAECGVPVDNFSARWTRTVYFSAGTYRFTATADDGVRLYVDGARYIDAWIDQPPTPYNVDLTLAAGNHTLQMDYYERGVGAVAALSWAPVQSACMNGNTPSGTNLALGAACNSDTVYGPGWDCTRARDGVTDGGSKWTSTADSSTHWLTYDLGSTRTVNGYIVRHAGAGNEPTYYNTQQLKLQTASSLSGPWNDDATVDNNAQANVTTRTYCSPKAVRFIRLYITDAGIDNYARIPEFEVRGQ